MQWQCMSNCSTHMYINVKYDNGKRLILRLTLIVQQVYYIEVKYNHLNYT